jgi:transposase
MNRALAAQCHQNFVPSVMVIPSTPRHDRLGAERGQGLLWLYISLPYDSKEGDNGRERYVIIMTPMGRRIPPREDAKTTALRAAGALHPHPEAVQDAAFAEHEFFDTRDRVQVKYEMLRRHRVEGRPVTAVATAFGVSRQAFYSADAAFTTAGLPGLLPRRRGPKRAHKCSEAILEFVEGQRTTDPTVRSASVVAAIERQFGVRLHPRSLDRALARRKKNRPTPQGSAP